MKSKIKSLKQIQTIAENLRKNGKKIVFTNGCFDILHAGHVSYLSRAKQMGDVLVVGLNSDRSVREIKGSSRPVNSENARAIVLSALEAVDFVVVFGERDPLRLICTVKPHVLVKGSDWQIQKMVGAKEVKAWNGTVRRIPLLKGYSTTGCIKKLASR